MKYIGWHMCETVGITFYNICAVAYRNWPLLYVQYPTLPQPDIVIALHFPERL